MQFAWFARALALVARDQGRVMRPCALGPLALRPRHARRASALRRAPGCVARDAMKPPLRRASSSTEPLRRRRGASTCRPRRRATSRCCGCSPATALTLFNGRRRRMARAEVVRMGRTRGRRAHRARATPSSASCALAVTLALGMPANERMDALVEKATELGVGAIQPLLCERSVLRLSGERAEREASRTGRRSPAPPSEQCGPHPRAGAARRSRRLRDWLAARSPTPPTRVRRIVLSLAAAPAVGDRRWPARAGQALVLSQRPGGRPQRLPRSARRVRRRLPAGRRSARACCAPTPRRSPCWPGSASSRSLETRR